MTHSKVSKKIKIFSTVSIILIIGVIVATVIMNSSIKEVLANRDTRLDLYEETKMWVMDDVRSYLSIRNADTFTRAKSSVHFSKELSSELFGSEYNESIHSGYSDVSFVDAQYSLERDGTVKYYLLANVTKGNETKGINLMVFVANNQIYDIVAY